MRPRRNPKPLCLLCSREMKRYWFTYDDKESTRRWICSCGTEQNQYELMWPNGNEETRHCYTQGGEYLCRVHNNFEHNIWYVVLATNIIGQYYPYVMLHEHLDIRDMDRIMEQVQLMAWAA